LAFFLKGTTERNLSSKILYSKGPEKREEWRPEQEGPAYAPGGILETLESGAQQAQKKALG